MLNRRRTRLGAVLVGATLLIGAGAALSACSSGQITQTDTQVAAVPGANAKTADGQVSLLNGLIVYAPKYEPNTTVPLDLRLVNDGTQDVRLTGAVTADGNGTVVLVGGGSSPSAAPAPSGSAAPSSAPSASSSDAGSASVDVDLPAGQLVILSSSQTGGSYLAITKRSDEIVPGKTVGVNFTFTYADGKSVVLTANLPVGVPLSPPTQEPPASA
jgi:hypothetical protein